MANKSTYSAAHKPARKPEGNKPQANKHRGGSNNSPPQPKHAVYAAVDNDNDEYDIDDANWQAPPLAVKSKDNPKFKQVRELLTSSKTRKAEQQTVIEGVHLLASYQARGLTPSMLIYSEASSQHPDVLPFIRHWKEVLQVVLPEHLYKDLRELGPGRDVMAVIKQTSPALPDTFKGDVLLLENVQDAGNVGTLLRSAAAAGITDVICTVGTASVWSPRVLRAGMGAQFSLNMHEQYTFESIAHRLSGQILATSSHTPTAIYDVDLTQPTTWLMGNEGAGVSDMAMQKAKAITIPQPGGQESLNVAIAGSICFFEMIRQRR